MNMFIQVRTLILLVAMLANGGLMHASASGSLCTRHDALPAVLTLYAAFSQQGTSDLFPASRQEKNNPLGIEVEPVELSRGVRVKAVRPNSPGERIGLQPGDIITMLHKEMIYNTDKFQEVASRLPSGEEIEIRVQRGAEQVKAHFQLSPE